MRTPEQLLEAKERRKVYMREYKRQEYANKNELMKSKQRIYYHTKNSNMDIPMFDIMPLEFTKLTVCLNKIKSEHPDELKEYLNTYANIHLTEEC